MSLLYDRAGALVRKIYDARLSGPPVLDARVDFPDADRFASAWETIRDEALEIARTLPKVPRFHEVMASQADISANDERDWRIFIIKAYGTTIRHNAKRCPQLTDLVNTSRDVVSASLSFLAPRKYVPPHRGPFRGVLRYHLGLVVPRNPEGQAAAILTVDGVPHAIGDGETLLWDDTYMHEVTNHSDSVRIALLLDVRRRGMPLDLELLTRCVIGLVGTSVRLSSQASM
jgi:aspartate beta-hydroxylase